MSIVDTAAQIASFAYSGRVDGAGKPYILHAMRVAAGLTDPYDQALALLHNVLEAKSYTPEVLAKNLPPKIVHAITAITRPAGEDYERFIARVAHHPFARRVKIALIRDNLDTRRLADVGFNEEDRARHHAYELALRHLEDMQARTAVFSQVPNANPVEDQS